MPRAAANGTAGNRKYINITLDADALPLLVAAQDRLTAQWGFKPTLSQVVKYVLHTSAGEDNNSA